MDSIRTVRSASPVAGAGPTTASLGTARSADAASAARPMRTAACRRTPSSAASRPGRAVISAGLSAPSIPTLAALRTTTGAPASTSVACTARPPRVNSSRGEPVGSSAPVVRPAGSRNHIRTPTPGKGTPGMYSVPSSSTTPPGVGTCCTIS